jgi:hypothetical protein
MKNYFKHFLLAGAAFFSLAASNAQFIEIQGGTFHLFYPEAASSSEHSVYLKNIGTAPLDIAYEKVSVDYPQQWGTPSFCDNIGCYIDFPKTGTFATMAPGEKGSIKIGIIPQGSADTAIIKYAVWDVKNPNLKDTITFRIMVRWSAGTQLSVMPQQAIYPVPANQFLQVNTLNADYLEIRSLSGQTVSRYYPDAAWSRLDIANLANGSYVLLLKGKNDNRSYTFLKN